MSKLQPSRFYPIVPDYSWLARLVPLGVKTIQLRIKDSTPEDILRQIEKSLTFCENHNCQLIVNDYWDLALTTGANYIHLGQEDLAALPEDARHKLREAWISIGISTHDKTERSVALAIKPDYIALGPIWETKLKKMKWHPQGLAKLSYWKEGLVCPLVAIGGITPQRAKSALDAGADSIAVITDFLTHEAPEKRVAEWLELLES